MQYKSFTDLPIWITSVSLIEQIYKITENFPKSEFYNLTNQLRRSSVSIAGNIAESWGRYFYKDKIRVLYIARGEIEETRSHLAVALRLKYFFKKEYLFIDKQYSNLLFDLNKHKKTLIVKNNK